MVHVHVFSFLLLAYPLALRVLVLSFLVTFVGLPGQSGQYAFVSTPGLCGVLSIPQYVAFQ